MATFQIAIGEDGFVRLPIRVRGPDGRSVRLIGIVDTGSSYVIIPPFACNMIDLEPFDPEQKEVSVLTGGGLIVASLRKAREVEIVGSEIKREDVTVLCHQIPRGISIIGHSFLKGCKATFDWKHRVFILEE